MKPKMMILAVCFLAAMPAAAQDLKFPLPCTSQPLAGRSIFHHHPGIDKKLAAYLKTERPAWYAALLLPRDGKDMTPAQIRDQAFGCSFMNRELMKGMTVADVEKMWGRPSQASASSDFIMLEWDRYVPALYGWDIAGIQVTFKGSGGGALVVDWLRFR
jgi:hypothetical protein